MRWEALLFYNFQIKSKDIEEHYGFKTNKELPSY